MFVNSSVNVFVFVFEFVLAMDMVRFVFSVQKA